MSKINDGGPAFAHGNHEQGGDSGMSKREYFAIHADTTGIEFAEFAVAAAWMGDPGPDPDDFISTLEFTFRLDAFIRAKKADALIAELEKGGDA